MRRVRATVALALGAALLLPACASDETAVPGAPSEPPPDSPVSTELPSPASPAPEPSPMIVTPRPGEAVDVRPIPWTAADETAPGTLLVQFWSGVEECYRLDRVQVAGGEDSVTVTLFEGRVPTAEACIEIAVLKGVEVRLAAPLGDRLVVDGAAESG